jgi:hypothetical protein
LSTTGAVVGVTFELAHVPENVSILVDSGILNVDPDTPLSLKSVKPAAVTVIVSGNVEEVSSKVIEGITDAAHAESAGANSAAAITRNHRMKRTILPSFCEKNCAAISMMQP